MHNNKYVSSEIVAGSKVCFVHFSSRNRRLGKFDRYPTPEGASNIFINSGSKDWYVNGLPCFSGGFEGTLDELSKLIERTGSERVVCLGSSMGAFGAALAAGHLGVELVCFEPELHLNVYSGYSREDKVPGSLPRLEGLGSPRRALIISGVYAPSDVICAQYFSGFWPNTEGYVLSDCGLGTARHLKSAGLLGEVIRLFSERASVQPVLSSNLCREDLFDGYKFVSPARFGQLELEMYGECIFDNARLIDIENLARHLRERGAFSSALGLSQRAIQAHGALASLKLIEAQCLRRLRRDRESIEAFSSLQGDPGYRKLGLIGESMVHRKAGSSSNLARISGALLEDIVTDLESALALAKESWAGKTCDPGERVPAAINAVRGLIAKVDFLERDALNSAPINRQGHRTRMACAV